MESPPPRTCQVEEVAHCAQQYGSHARHLPLKPCCCHEHHVAGEQLCPGQHHQGQAKGEAWACLGRVGVDGMMGVHMSEANLLVAALPVWYE